MTKIVYNACHGGFNLSNEAILRYAEIKGLTLYPEEDERFKSLRLITYWLSPASDPDRETLYCGNISRTDEALLQVIEEMGEAANGRHARLQIRDVPAGMKYRIDEYDGYESVMTIDDYEWEVA